MSQHDRYISPFSTRYSSDEMQYIFSDDNKFRTWRRLWVALARAEMEQGLTNITPEMVAELEAHVDDINYEVAIAREKLVRHDVMSHVYAYGQQCPKAAGIIHLGATSCYVGDNTDIIVMRHYLEGAARYASEVTAIPIVNAGDGANQHPSQTMLDLYSIYKTQGTLENLNIYLVGDLKYGRTVHSLLMAMRHFNPTFHFIAPDELKMPEEYKIYCKEHDIKYVEHTDFTEETIAEADILYMTRVQRERFTDLMEYERVKNVYILRARMLENTRPNLRILHPLPRVNEIAYDVDESPKAYYFQQAQNGLYAREAILCDVLGITLEEVMNSDK